MRRKKANMISTIVLILILLVGLSVMLYPIISDWWNSKVQTRAIANYNRVVAELDDNESERIIAEAHDYNNKLAQLQVPFSQYNQISGYENILDISDSGIMGYISIPSIKAEFPIYHGTDEEVLNIAAGHLQGSSFPVGGINTHSVISAHRGLPSAKLFSDLDKMVVGDTFTVTVLDEVLTYEVEEIFIVKPNEMEKLAIIPGGDYITLMTCTPYGINTHRLLLRSHRIDTVYGHNLKLTSDAVQVDPMLVVPLIAAPLIIVLLIFWIFGGKLKKKKSIINRNTLYRLPNQKEEGD